MSNGNFVTFSEKVITLFVNRRLVSNAIQIPRNLHYLYTKSKHFILFYDHNNVTGKKRRKVEVYFGISIRVAL